MADDKCDVWLIILADGKRAYRKSLIEAYKLASKIGGDYTIERCKKK